MAMGSLFGTCWKFGKIKKEKRPDRFGRKKNNGFKKRFNISAFSGFLAMLLLTGFQTAPGTGGRQQLKGYVPKEASSAPLIGEMPVSEKLDLAIGFPLRNQDQLQALLKQLYDPQSPQYRQFLTPEQFAAQFGPTETDYQTVIDFVKAKGLSVIKTHSNRTLLEVSGSVGDIENIFNVKLHYYRRSDGSLFHAPDVEPSIDLNVPLQYIAGLEDHTQAQMFYKQKPLGPRGGSPLSGSGISGLYIGNDFRHAYVPCTSLNGSGQNIASLQMDAFYQNDIANYESEAGISSNVPIPVLCGGASGVPSNPNAVIEVSLDIEMQVSMAQGAHIYVYEGPNTPAGWDAVYSNLAAPPLGVPLAKQISSSWGWFLDTNISNAMLQFAAQGQSFFQASGDSDAYPSDPMDNRDGPDITLVGGTNLTMTGSGTSYSSETTWNDGGGLGGGGGIMTSVSIPGFQVGVPMGTNYGSTSYRNAPDVALTAYNVYVRANNGSQYGVEGTSCAAPLWAGFMALVNQQAANESLNTVGFANPALYAIGMGSNYGNDFHDINDGSNNGTSTHYPAVTGYDLATGWGSPKCNLITDLVGSIPLFCYSAQVGTLGSGSGQFNQPNGAAVYGTNLYVTDYSNNRVEKYNTSLGWVSHFATVSSPGQVAVDSYGNVYVTSQGSNNVQVFNSSGANILTFGSYGTGNGQFINPIGIAVDTNGFIYVSDWSNRVQKFTSLGAFVIKWGTSGTGSGQFNSPAALATDSSNYVYVDDTNNHRIQKFDWNGTYQLQFGSSGSGPGQFSGSWGIQIGPCGNVYATDRVANRIEVFTPSGVYVSQYGITGTANGQFKGVMGVAFDSSENLYTTEYQNNRVQKFTSCGISCPPTPTPTAIFCANQVVGTLGSGSYQFNQPNGAAIFGSNLYITDYSNNRVESYGTNLVWQSHFANVSLPGQVAVDSLGNVYVTSQGSNNVQVFNSTGTNILTFGSYGGGNGQFVNPIGVAVDSSGFVYVTDWTNRVQKFMVQFSGTPSATWQLQWGGAGTGNGQFNSPAAIAYDSAVSLLYVADTNNHRVQVFNTSGTYQNQFGVSSLTSGGFNSSWGIAVGPCGNIYATDRVLNRIEIFSPTGTYMAQYSSVGIGNQLGQLNGVMGIAFDSSNNLYTTEYLNNRIQKFLGCGIGCPMTPNHPSVVNRGTSAASDTLLEGKGGTPTTTVTPTPVADRLSSSVVAVPNISRGGQPVQFLANLDKPAKLTLTLVNVSGEQVFTESLQGNSGANILTWNLENSLGSKVSSGLYIYILTEEDGATVKSFKGKVAVLH